MIIRKAIAATGLMFFLAYGNGLAENANILALEKYLSQVEANNPEVKSLNLTIEAMDKKVRELDLVYAPFLSGGYSYLNDRSGPGFGSILPTEKMQADSWNLGLNKKFLSGTSLSLGYSSSKAKFDLLSPTKIIGDEEFANFTGYEIRPFLRVEQSLLRDFNSGQTQAGIKKIKAAILAARYAQIFKKQQILVAARSAYWSLAFAREVILSREASLTRAEKLLKWNEQRVSLDLADKSDLFQSEAAYKLRQLNLQLAREEEIKAGRNFNELRGISGDSVEEQTEILADRASDYANVNVLTRTGQRADVLSAQALYQSSQFANQETFYRSLPELNVFGSASLRGLGLSYVAARSQISGADKPAYNVGLTLIVPLDYATLSKVKKGYQLDYQAAKDALAKAELSAKNDWEQLLRNWSNVKSRLKLATEIREIQEKRVSEERFKFERGRTSTFLLLTAENDLDEAIIGVYRLMLEELITFSQAELYITQPLK